MLRWNDIVEIAKSARHGFPWIEPQARWHFRLGAAFGAHELKRLGSSSLVCIFAPPGPAPTMRIVSGSPSVKTTSTGAHEQWSSKAVTVVVDKSIETLGPAARTAIVAAFGTWAASGAKLPQVTVDHSTSSGRAEHDGINRVVVAPITLAGHEKDLAVTVAYADDRTGLIREADLIINANYDFSVLDFAHLSQAPKAEERVLATFCGT